MATITFDTQEAVIKLKSVGVSQEQADAFVRVIVESQSKLATKNDLDNGLRDLEQRLTIKLGAMIGFAIGIVAVLVKLL
jgi:hypothetical protein